jgi:hypothetical protein
MQRTGWGGSTGCIMHRVHTSYDVLGFISLNETITSIWHFTFASS